MVLDKCIHHHCIIQSIFTVLKILCAPPNHPFPPLKLLATTNLLTVSILLPFPECHIVGIINYVAFSNWLLPLSKMLLSFLHVFSWFDSSLLFSAE